jgi:hypothetical protein
MPAEAEAMTAMATPAAVAAAAITTTTTIPAAAVNRQRCIFFYTIRLPYDD